MNKYIRDWVLYLAIPGAAIGALVGLVAITDYLGVRPVLSREFTALKITVGANQQAVLLLRWQLLEQRRKTQGLTVSERVEYCAISRQLGLKTDGCL